MRERVGEEEIQVHVGLTLFELLTSRLEETRKGDKILSKEFRGGEAGRD